MTLRGIVLGPVVVLMLTGACFAQSFYLKDDATGKAHGPFVCKDGAKVKLGEASFTVVRQLAVKPTLAQKLKKTIVPQVDFRNARLSDVVDFLRQASVDFSPPAHGRHKGVNLILLLRGSEDPVVTFRAKALSLEEVLEAITSVTGFKTRRESNVVYIEPKR